MKKNQMKHILALLLVCLLAMFTLPMAALADDEDQSEEQKPWRSDLYHVGDFYGVLAEDYLIELNHENDEYIVETMFDYVVLIAGQSSYDDAVLTDYADEIYRKNKLGYGVNYDGICLCLDGDRENLTIRLYGRAWEIFVKENVDQLVAAVRQGYRDSGYEGAVSAFLSGAHEIVKSSESVPANETKSYLASFDTTFVSLKGSEPATLQIVDGQALPSWYVTDPSAFVDFHNDENEPRLIDLAGLLTPAEETEIKARLADIREETNQDVVIYTDVTSYGMDNEEFTKDFYVYKGYGIGPEFDGLVLFINMDPDNREMVSASFGLTRTVFNDSMSSRLDDILYDHLVNKDYYGAFSEWADGVENLLKYGSVDIPDWYRAYRSGENMEAYRSDKLFDDIDGIRDADAERIEKEIARLAEKYDTDIVVYLSDKAYSLKPSQGLYEDYPSDMDPGEERVNRYLDTFWEACGYGFGEDHSGILIGIFVDESSMYNIQVRGYGKATGTSRAKTISKNAEKQLESVTLLNLGSGDYDYNVNRYLSFLGRFLRFGFVPHSWGTRIFWLILCSIGGLIVASVTTSRAKAKNRTVKETLSLDAFLVQRSFQVRDKLDTLLGVRVERKYIEPRESSSSSSRSSSGSSSRSTYSSHSTSSSGRVSSTSRRKF